MPATTAVLTREFIEALQHAERSGDVDVLVALFSGDAELDNLTEQQPQRGHDGAHKFWTRYLESFGSIRSEFVRVRENGDHAVLEWRSQGTLATGLPVDYRGVSLLDFEGDKIQRFMSYYDSAALVSVQPLATAATSRSSDPNIEAPVRKAK